MVLKKTLESSLDSKEIKPVNPKGNQSWILIGKTDAEAQAPTPATRCEELTHWKRPWCWERLRAGGEEGNRGWDGWMDMSLSKLHNSVTLAWVSWWWTGKPGVLQSMESQRIGHNWATELTDIGHTDGLREHVAELHPCGSLNYFYGAFLSDFLWPIILICLVHSPYFVHLRILPWILL